MNAIAASIAAMGRAAPADSIATGTVTVVAGSQRDSGMITIITRGVGWTSEELQTEERGDRATVYSSGAASRVSGGASAPLPPELAVSSQCPDFPLPILVGALSNTDFSFQYAGTDTIDGAPAFHIRFWNTFASSAGLRSLADFTAKEIWISAASALPLRLSWELRAAGGSAPRIPMQADYSDFRNVGGLLYPFQISESKNGTPWMQSTIQRVRLNTGITDASFRSASGGLP